MNNQIYLVMIRMVQFISIILRKDIKNEKYVNNVKDQLEFISSSEISAAVLNLLKNCSEDSYLNRIEIINSLKNLIKSYDKDKFKDFSEVLDEEIIFGKFKFPSIYAKNAIYNNWIEILINIFIQSETQRSQDQMDIQNYAKILDSLLKNIFDNTLYLNIQQSSLKL